MDITELLTTTNRYTITLPFDFRQVSNRRCTVEALEYERGGWSWYVEAQDLHDVESGEKLRLGTLGYLPFEIMQRIYGMVLDDDVQNVFEFDPTLIQYQEELDERGFTD